MMASEKQLCLSDRLQAIADLVPRGSRVADIGTDHAYLPIWLLQQGRVSFAAACDVKEGPLQRARASAARYGFDEALSFRLGDGLADISPDEVDVITIAGMGGETIIAILEAALWTKSGNCRLLLQPMTKAELLRPWLAANGYRFLEERLVYENHTYFPVMAVTGGGEACTLSLGEIWGGVKLEHDPLQGNALDDTIRHLSFAVTGLERSSVPENAEKADYYRAILEQLRQMKEEWSHANGQGN